jgi:hypothetical protein
MTLLRFYREPAKKKKTPQLGNLPFPACVCVVKLGIHFNAAMYIVLFHFRSDNGTL